MVIYYHFSKFMKNNWKRREELELTRAKIKKWFRRGCSDMNSCLEVKKKSGRIDELFGFISFLCVNYYRTGVAYWLFNNLVCKDVGFYGVVLLFSMIWRIFSLNQYARWLKICVAR